MTKLQRRKALGSSAWQTNPMSQVGQENKGDTGPGGAPRKDTTSVPTANHSRMTPCQKGMAGQLGIGEDCEIFARSPRGNTRQDCLSEWGSEAETQLTWKTKKMLCCESDFVARESCSLHIYWENCGGCLPYCWSYVFQNSLPSVVHIGLGHKRKIAGDLEGRSKAPALRLPRSFRALAAADLRGHLVGGAAAGPPGPPAPLVLPEVLPK